MGEEASGTTKGAIVFLMSNLALQKTISEVALEERKQRYCSRFLSEFLSLSRTSHLHFFHQSDPTTKATPITRY